MMSNLRDLTSGEQHRCLTVAVADTEWETVERWPTLARAGAALNAVVSVALSRFVS